MLTSWPFNMISRKKPKRLKEEKEYVAAMHELVKEQVYGNKYDYNQLRAEIKKIYNENPNFDRMKFVEDLIDEMPGWTRILIYEIINDIVINSKLDETLKLLMKINRLLNKK